MSLGSLFDWMDATAERVIERAARRAPTFLAQRLREEWAADLSDRRGPIARLELALGCYWAAMLIRHDTCVLSAPASTPPVAAGVIAATVPRGMSLFPRQTPASATGRAVCEINTTPLIDVLLVLIVALIMTLPLLTHAVQLDLPHATARQTPPEVINLDIDFDGTILWNGSPVANLAQLEGYFRTEGQRYPQPELHLRPNPYVKYGVVAQVLAAAQRNRLQKLGVVTSGAFAD